MPPFSLAYLGRMAVTLAVTAVAVIGALALWRHYQRDPWTRDGRVRADVVQVAPDVSGLVTAVAVIDNQAVRRGDVLFQIDRDRYALALRQAEAQVAAQRAAVAEARREAQRNLGLGDLVARETLQQSQERAASATAALDQAIAQRDLAALNLQRTTVRAPVDGYLSDLTLRVGDYVSPGRAVIGLIDGHSFRVEGYFEETKLARLRVGQPARILVMGEPRPLSGHVQSIAAGIEDRDRQAGSNLLPNVNPTFSWVRLAQRVPVRIAIDRIPAGLKLISGRTATVSILGPDGRPARAP